MTTTTRLWTATLALLLVSAAPGCSQAPGDYDPYADTDDWPEDDSGPPDASTDADSDTDSDSDGDTETGTGEDTDTETSTGDDTGTETASDTWEDTDTGSDSETATEPDTGSETDTGTGPDACSGPGVFLDPGEPWDEVGWDTDTEWDHWWPGERCWEDPPPIGLMTWAEAVTHCEDLDLNGYDDWTLPTITQLRTLARGCADDPPPCGLHDPDELHILDAESCDGCLPYEGPGPGGCYWMDGIDEDGCTDAVYWSTSEVEDYYSGSHVWGWVYNNNGPIDKNKEGVARVRCVRPL